MVRRYFFEIDQSTQDELDSNMFEYGMDDYVWWEDNNRCLVTDNPKVINDLEQMLEELEVEYTFSEEE